MKQTFYIFENGEYVPYAEYDSDIRDSFREGNYLIQCMPGTKLTRKIVDTDYVSALAAINIFKEELVSLMVRNASMQLSVKHELSEEQRQAWEAFEETMVDTEFQLYRDSIYQCVERATEFLLKKSKLLIGAPNVQEAYEEFMTFLKLVQDESQRTTSNT